MPMNWMHKQLSKKTFFVVFNVLMLLYCWYEDQLHCDPISLLALIVAFALMNWVAWQSSKDFPEWK